MRDRNRIPRLLAVGFFLITAAVLPLGIAAQSNQAIPPVTAQPDVKADVAPYFTDPSKDPSLSQSEMEKLLQQKVKYVFVIFNENHSFDNEFGTFPGVNGLYSDGLHPRSAADTPGFSQDYIGVDGVHVTVQPFGIGLDRNSTVVDSVDHSHKGLASKIDVVDGVARMDGFAKDEYLRFASKGGAANVAQGTQYARLVMSHIDGDTIPFMWLWASRFTMFDNIFATEDTPSTPNAVAILAGQSGETQWVKHGSGRSKVLRRRPHRDDSGSASRQRPATLLWVAVRCDHQRSAAARSQ